MSFQVVEDLCSGRLDIKAARAMTYACEIALQAAEKEDEKASAEIAAKLTPAELEWHRLVELSGPANAGAVRLRAIERIYERFIAT